jgi:CDGSH-type Zn-finger protein
MRFVSLEPKSPKNGGFVLARAILLRLFPRLRSPKLLTLPGVAAMAGTCIGSTRILVKVKTRSRQRLVRQASANIRESIMSDNGNKNLPEPAIPQKKPFIAEVEAGKSYWWCACGKSATQPFCSGAHKGTPFRPIEFKALKTEKVFFCGCKHSGHKPLCDGTHKTL